MLNTEMTRMQRDQKMVETCLNYERATYGYGCWSCTHCSLAMLHNPGRMVHYCNERKMIVANHIPFDVRDSRELYTMSGELICVIEPGDETKWMKEVTDVEDN